MSEENVERYRAFIDAWNRDDLDTALEQLDPDFEFQTAELFADTEAVYRGHEGAREFWDTFRSAWEKLTVTVARVEDLGDDRVLGLLAFQGRGRESGVEVSVPYAHLATIAHDSLVHLRGFARWEDALEAAGLSE